MIHFTLYSRSYCHLCEDMLRALQSFNAPDRVQTRFTVDVVDVDANEELLAQYDELVPVLLGSKVGGNPVRLCHYFLDEQKVKAFLEQNSVY